MELGALRYVTKFNVTPKDIVATIRDILRG